MRSPGKQTKNPAWNMQIMYEWTVLNYSFIFPFSETFLVRRVNEGPSQWTVTGFKFTRYILLLTLITVAHSLYTQTSMLQC